MAFQVNVRMTLSGPTNIGQVVQQIQSQLSNIQGNVRINVSGATANLQGLNQQLAGTTANLNQTGSAALSASQSMLRFASALSGVGSTARTAFSGNMGGFFDATRAGAIGAGTAIERFGEQSGLALRRFLAFSTAATAFITVVSGIRTGITQAIQFQRELIRFQQISGDTAQAVGEVSDEITRLARNYGVSSLELAKAGVTIRQAGFNAQETRTALETLAQAALSPNFGQMSENVEGLIAIMSQFRLSMNQAQASFSSINAVAAEFAVEAKDIILAVQRAGGVFATLGGSFNEFNALFSSVRATTRESAETISTGLRTIFARLQRQDTIDALRELRINLRYTAEEAVRLGDINLTDQLVKPADAIRRLQDGLRGIRQTDPRYAAVTEQIGGIRQLSRVLPLLQQNEMQERALNIAESAGTLSLIQNAEKAQGGLLVRTQQVGEAFLHLFRTIANNDAFQSLVKSLLQVAETLADVGRVLVPLLPSLIALGAVKLAGGILPYASGFATRANPRSANFFNTGGNVPGSGYTDSVPALLTPGEFVIRREIVDRVGSANLEHLNSTGKMPGYNRGGTVKLNNGGYIREVLKSIHKNTGINTSPFYRKIFIDKEFGLDKQFGEFDLTSRNIYVAKPGIIPGYNLPELTKTLSHEIGHGIDTYGAEGLSTPFFSHRDLGSFSSSQSAKFSAFARTFIQNNPSYTSSLSKLGYKPHQFLREGFADAFAQIAVGGKPIVHKKTGFQSSYSGLEVLENQFKNIIKEYYPQLITNPKKFATGGYIGGYRPRPDTSLAPTGLDRVMGDSKGQYRRQLLERETMEGRGGVATRQIQLFDEYIERIAAEKRARDLAEANIPTLLLKPAKFASGGYIGQILKTIHKKTGVNTSPFYNKIFTSKDDIFGGGTTDSSGNIILNRGVVGDYHKGFRTLANILGENVYKKLGDKGQAAALAPLKSYFGDGYHYERGPFDAQKSAGGIFTSIANGMFAESRFSGFRQYSKDYLQVLEKYLPGGIKKFATGGRPRRSTAQRILEDLYPGQTTFTEQDLAAAAASVMPRPDYLGRSSPKPRPRRAELARLLPDDLVGPSLPTLPLLPNEAIPTPRPANYSSRSFVDDNTQGTFGQKYTYGSGGRGTAQVGPDLRTVSVGYSSPIGPPVPGYRRPIGPPLPPIPPDLNLPVGGQGFPYNPLLPRYPSPGPGAPLTPFGTGVLSGTEFTPQLSLGQRAYNATLGKFTRQYEATPQNQYPYRIFADRNLKSFFEKQVANEGVREFTTDPVTGLRSRNHEFTGEVQARVIQHQEKITRLQNARIELQEIDNRLAKRQNLTQEQINKDLVNRRALTSNISDLKKDVAIVLKDGSVQSVGDTKVGLSPEAIQRQQRNSNLALTASFLVPLVTSQIQQGIGNANAGSDGRYVVGQGILSGLSGGAVGGLVGTQAVSAFGLTGTLATAVPAISAAVFGITALLTSLNDASKQIAQAKLTENLTSFSSSLNALTIQISNGVTPSFEEISSARTSLAGANQNALDVGTRNARYFGFIPGSEASQRSEVNRVFRETVGNQTADISGLLGRSARQLGSRNPTESISTIQTRLFGDNNGLNRELITNLSRLQNRPVNAILDQFKQEILRGQNQTIRGVAEGGENRLFTAFGKLAQAVEDAVVNFNRFDNVLKALAGFGSGSFTAALGQSSNVNLFDRLGGPSFRELTVSALSGVQGQETGRGLQNELLRVDEFARILPNVLAESFSRGLSNTEGVTSTVRQNLTSGLGINIDNVSGQDRQILNSIIGRIGALDFQDIEKLSQDTESFARSLLQGFQPLLGVVDRIVRGQEQAISGLLAGLDQYNKLLAQSAETSGRAADLRFQSVRTSAEFRASNQGGTPFGIITRDEANAPFISRQSGLLGNIANNPTAITSRLNVLRGEITSENQRLSTLGPTSPNAEGISRNLGNLNSEAARLYQALQNLTNVSLRTAFAQERLRELDNQRASILSFGQNYVGAGSEGRFEIRQGLALINEVVRGGNQITGRFSQQEVDQVFSTLNRLGSTEIPGLGIASDIQRNILEREGFRIPQDRERERETLQQEIVNTQRDAAEAMSQLAEVQRSSAEDFFGRLNSNFERFLNDLSRNLQRTELDSLRTRRNAELVSQAPLNRLQEQATFLRREGNIPSSLSQNAVQSLQTPLVRQAISNLTTRFNPIRESLNLLDTPVGGNLISSIDTRAFSGGARNSYFGTHSFISGASAVNNVLNPLFNNFGINDATTQGQITRQIGGRLRVSNLFDGQSSFTDEQVQQAIRSSIHDVLSNRRDDFLNQRENIDDINLIRNAPGLSPLNINGLLQSGRLGQTVTAAEAFQARGINSFADLDDAISTSARSIAGLGTSIHNLSIQINRANPNFVGPLPLERANGGSIFSPRGTDTVPAMLTPGEYVINERSSRANLSLLQRINSAKGPVYLQNGGVSNPYLQTPGTTNPYLLGTQNRRNFEFEEALRQAEFDRTIVGGIRRRLELEAANRLIPSEALQRVRQRFLQESSIPPSNDAIDRVRAHIDNFGQNSNALTNYRNRQPRQGEPRLTSLIGRETDNILGSFNSVFLQRRTNRQESLQNNLLRRIQNNQFYIGQRESNADVVTRLEAAANLVSNPGGISAAQLAYGRGRTGRANSQYLGGNYNGLLFAQLSSQSGLSGDVGGQYGLLSQQLRDRLQGNSRSLQNYRFRGYADGGLVQYFPIGGQVLTGGYDEYRRIQNQPRTSIEMGSWINGNFRDIPFTNLVSPSGTYNFGTDTVPAMLTPGEYVLRKEAVNKIGLSGVQRMNATGYANGGLVGTNNTGGIDYQPFINALQTFNTNSMRLVEALSKFPTSLTIEGRQTVEVIINGAQVLTEIIPQIRSMIVQQTQSSLNNMLKDKFPDIHRE